MVSELVYWCCYRVCDMREKKDARPRVDALTAPTSNKCADRAHSHRYMSYHRSHRKASSKAIYGRICSIRKAHPRDYRTRGAACLRQDYADRKKRRPETDVAT
jgi:hypothetical protein